MSERMSDLPIEVRDLVKRYDPRPGDPGRRRGGITALDGVGFAVGPGRTLGVIGRNGSGKTTLLKVLAGTLAPTSGSVSVSGRVLGFVEIGGGFDEALTGRENVLLYGTFLGLSRKDVAVRLPEVTRFAGLDGQLDRPFGTYSSGMRMRLAFGTALLKDPDVLLLDEVLAVGDEEFQHRSYRRIEELKRRGKTIVLVSHSMETVRGFCDEAICLEGGKIVAEGDTGAVIASYLERVWDTERDQLLGDTESRVAELRGLDERLSEIERGLESGSWLPTRFQELRSRSSRSEIHQALQEMRVDLDDRFQRVVSYLAGRSALGRDLALRETFAAQDLDQLARVLDEASRFYTDPHRTEEVLVRWKELAYREVERATLAGDRPAEARARTILVRALSRERELHDVGPARDRAALEKIEALAGLHRASGEGDRETLIALVETVADEILGERGVRTDGFASMAIQQLEGAVHELFQIERSSFDELRRAVFHRWLDRLTEAPPDLFRRVHPRWMVERMREQAARAALEGRREPQDWLMEAEARLVGMAGVDQSSPRGPLSIAGVRFLGEAGEPVAEIVSGAPLVVEIRYRAHEPADSPMLGVGIHDSGGLLLAAPNTSTSGAEVGWVREDGVVRLTIASLPLTAGIYPVSVSIMSRSGDRLIDYHDRRYAIRVVDVEGVELLGRLRLATRWEILKGA